MSKNAMTAEDFQAELSKLIDRAASSVDHHMILAILQRTTHRVDADLRYFSDNPTMSDEDYERGKQ